ncbi:DKNYY domain-containing protein [uncultured Alistipes sp.]|uniref:DKNYY domain-containing protein n=1 Tax=uncultured Alistipes sp. TaxID=538949 RepID=UPI002622EB5A|nr:DKNYY domain-containing protein [uncultured Alistipes sp.]
MFYAGQEVKGASASSFEGLGGGYGKDNWKVYYRGRELSGTSPASFGKLRPERR